MGGIVSSIFGGGKPKTDKAAEARARNAEQDANEKQQQEAAAAGSRAGFRRGRGLLSFDNSTSRGSSTLG